MKLSRRTLLVTPALLAAPKVTPPFPPIIEGSFTRQATMADLFTFDPVRRVVTCRRTKPGLALVRVVRAQERGP